MKSGRDFNVFMPVAVALGITIVLFLSIDESDAELLRLARIAIGIAAAFITIQTFRAALRWNKTRSARPPAPRRTATADPSGTPGFMIGDTGSTWFDIGGGPDVHFGHSSSDCASSDSSSGDCGGGDSGGGDSGGGF